MGSRTLRAKGEMDSRTLEVMKMKRILLMTSILIVFASTSLAGPFKGDRPGRFKERITTLRNWELMEFFDLSEERAQKVFSILKGFDKEREQLIIERKMLMDSIRREANDPSTPAETLEKLISRYHDLNMKIAELPKKEIEGLREVFSTRELARYIIFSERFTREIKGAIYRKMEERRRDAPWRR